MTVGTLETLENGYIYFYTRPVLEEDYPCVPPDIDRLFAVLNPHQNQRLYRVLVLGKKKSVQLDQDSTTWGFVQKIGSSADQIENELDPKKYHTKSRGERQFKSPKLIGQGVYRFSKHLARIYFSYAIGLVQRQDGVIYGENLCPQFTFILKIKNPEMPSPVGVGLSLDRHPNYPGRLTNIFKNRRYADPDNIEFLDYEGTGMLLISPQHEKFSDFEIDQAPVYRSAADDLVCALKNEQQMCTIEPLLRSRWC